MNIKSTFELSAEMVEVKNLKVGEKIKVLREVGADVEMKLGVVVDISKFTSDSGDGTVAVEILLITSDYWKPASFSVVTITEKNQNQYQLRPLNKETEETMVREIERSLEQKINEKEKELFELNAHKNKLVELNFIRV